MWWSMIVFISIGLMVIFSVIGLSWVLLVGCRLMGIVVRWIVLRRCSSGLNMIFII